MIADKFEKYIVWVDYGGDGWSPVNSFKTFDEASAEYLDRVSTNGSDCVLITEYIPVKLIPAHVEKITQPVMRG